MADVMIPPWLQPQPIAQMYAQGMNTGVAAAAQHNEAARAAAALQQQAAIQASEMALRRDIAAQQAAQQGLSLQMDQQRNAALMALRERDMMNDLAWRSAQLQNYGNRLGLQQEMQDLRERQLESKTAEADRNYALRLFSAQNRIAPQDQIELAYLRKAAEEARKEFTKTGKTSQDAAEAETAGWTIPFIGKVGGDERTVRLHNTWKDAENAYNRKLSEIQLASTGFPASSNAPVQIPDQMNVPTAPQPSRNIRFIPTSVR